jgi:hypothetical protein
MQGKTVRKAQKQSKFYTLNLIETNTHQGPARTANCKYVHNQHTGQKCNSNEGAEGWARLGRDFDLQLSSGVYL